MRTCLMKAILACIAFAVFARPACAQFNNKPVEDNILQGTQVVANAEVAAWADYFNGTSLPASSDLSWHPSYKFIKSDGRAVLSVRQAAEGITLASFNCTVVINLTYYKWDPNITPPATNEVITVNNISLTVDYNKVTGTAYKERDFYMVQNAHYVKARVVSVSNPSLAKYLDLQVEVEQERYFPVANTALTPTFTSAAPTYNTTTNEITLRFNQTPVAGFAVEYDLEWTFIENYNNNGTNVINPSLVVNPSDFRFNSSRVTIIGTEYILNNLYEMGFIAYRVRAVGKDLTTAPEREVRRVECNWSDIQVIRISPSPSLPGLGEHLAGFNWQYLATYAEEGKKNETVIYHDGSLRQRQIVTQMTDAQGNEHAVVHDKIYDYQGRPAIEVLPVPITTSAIKYYPGQSLNNASTPVPYSKTDFDVDQSANCNPPAGEMSNTAGASRYYSSNNDFKSASETNFNNYTPVANGFPFVHTVYTPDNTGRTAAKSSPGAAHRIGGGHETKYSYLKPDQVELDRLFGSEAGYAEHYQKLVVKDANGQASISYVNAKGQLVATCLAGKPDMNSMQQLSTYQSNAYNETTALVVDLMNANDKFIENNALVTTHSFYVAEAADYKFKYSMNAAKYNNPECVTPGYCVDCAYDLTISITDQCDVQYRPQGTGTILVNKPIGNFPDGTNYNTCASPTPSYTLGQDYTADGNGYITVPLVPGTYTITKRLKVSDTALDFYTQKYLEDRKNAAIPGCKTLADFQQEALRSVDMSDCGLTCESCWQKLGFSSPPSQGQLEDKRDEYVTEQMNQLTAAGGTPTLADQEAAAAAFNTLSEQCVDLCTTVSADRCESIKQILMADVKPGGQYAKYLLDNVSATFSADDNSGADQYNALGLFHQSGESSDNLMSYQNIDPTTGFPEFDNVAYGVILPGNTTATKVKDLTVDQFVKNFKEEWAEILFRNHPEYCHYKKCSLNQASFDYDQDMLNTSTYDEAVTKNYLTPIVSQSVSNDPYFNSSCGSEYLGGRSDRLDIWDRVNYYKSAPRYYTYTYIKDDIELLEANGSSQVDLYDKRDITTYVASILHAPPAVSGDYVYLGGTLIGIYDKTDMGGGQWLNRIKRINPANPPEILTYNFTLKQVAMMPIFCPEYIIGQTRRLFNCLDKAQTTGLSASCEDARDRYWVNFRSIYLANKGFLQYKIDAESNVSGCRCDPQLPSERDRRIYPKLSEEHDIEMYRRNGTLYDPRTLEMTKAGQDAEYNRANDKIIESCNTQCTLYAEYWKEKLSGCGLTPSEMDQVIGAMIDVCKNGCDQNNPMGSSTVDPAKIGSVDYESFHDVLKNVLGHNIYQAKICDELMIKSPKPFAHDYLAYLSPYADTCSCDQTYNYKGAGGGICVEPLNGITPPDCPCANNTAISAKVKKQLLIGKGKDPRFACNRCIGCLDLLPAVTAFRNWYPTLTSEDSSYHELFEAFLNNTLNMNVTWMDYLQLIKSCMGENAFEKSEMDETDSLLEAYVNFFAFIEKPFTVGASMQPVNLIRMEQGRTMMASAGSDPARWRAAETFTRENSVLTWSPKIDLELYLAVAGEEKEQVMLASTEKKSYVPAQKTVEVPELFKPITVPGILHTQADGTPPPGFGPKAPGVDECGCEKLLKVWQENPTKTDEELSQIFAQKHNYGQKIDNFSKLKQLCCKSYANQSINVNAPKKNPINLNPDDEENGDVDPPPAGGGDNNAPCLPPPAGENIVFSPAAKERLQQNIQTNNTIKFPGNVLCDPNPNLSQVDICGCDRLMELEQLWLNSGSAQSFSDYVSSQIQINYNIPEIDKILDLCKLLKGEGDWDIDKVANLYQQTSDPLLKLPSTYFKCEPPEDPCPGCGIGGGGGGGGGWDIPKPCMRNKAFSCSEFENMMRSVFGTQYHVMYNMSQMDLFVSSHQAQWNSQLLPAFKNLIGMDPSNPDCWVNISFTQDAEQCGFPRKKYTSFSIRENANDAEITNLLKRIAAYGCGCTPPPAWLQTSMRPDQPCTECFGTTRQLTNVQTFLNFMAKDQNTVNHNGVNYTYNNFRYYGQTPAPASVKPIYSASFNANGIKWDNRVPYMDQFYKLDVYDGAVVKSSIVLGFDNAHPSHRVYFIRKFFNIRASCPDPEDHFTVDVELDVYDPYAITPQPQRVIKTIRGYIESEPGVVMNFVKKFSCCAKLCNKPAVPQFEPEPCGAELLLAADLNAVKNYNAYMEDAKNKFRNDYIAHCLSARNSEQFMMKYNSGEYNYTLYYYDQSGNLVKTIPPQGVVLLTASTTPSLAQAKAARESYNPSVAPVVPVHTLASNFQYNSLNQLIWQKTPDAGISEFYFDQLGRIIFSQDAKQKKTSTDNSTNVYSYIRYDALARTIETGEVTSATQSMDHVKSRLSNEIELLLAGTRTQITRTYYDAPVNNAGINALFPQRNLRNRISWSTVQQTISYVDQEAYYTYDVHGNVQRIGRQINSLVPEFDQGLKTVDYEYDLVSGKVNTVIYQKGLPDQYMHKYLYDRENRLTYTYTGQRPETLEPEAQYHYYLHGPIARVEHGRQLVQGTDYVYNINGWIKGVNSISLDASRDIGRDGYYDPATATLHTAFARDVYGYSLDYFSNDYSPVNSGAGFSSFKGTHASGSLVSNASGALYNGNISAMVTAIGKFMENGATPLASVYTYDYLNRVSDARYYNNFNRATNEWLSTGTLLTDYRNTFSYDGNGNIKTQVRNGSRLQGYDMDDLNYVYKSGTNQLMRVEDTRSSSLYVDDIDGQQRVPANSAYANYEYDPIGNLVKDKAEEIDEIKWNIYGKIIAIKRIATSSRPDIEFEYTPDGHRSVKKVIPKAGGFVSYTYYMRDAQGNIMATYTRKSEKIIDYNELTYASVNTKLIQQVGVFEFANFMYQLHPANSANQSLHAHLFSSITSSPASTSNFFPTRSPIGVLLSQDYDPTFYQNMLNALTDADFIRSVIAHPADQPSDLRAFYERASEVMKELNSMDGSYPTLQYAFFDNLTIREYFLRQFYIMDPSQVDAMMDYLGYSGSGTIDDKVSYYLGLGTQDVMLFDDNYYSESYFYDLIEQIDAEYGPFPHFPFQGNVGDYTAIESIANAEYEPRKKLLSLFTSMGGKEPSELLQLICQCLNDEDQSALQKRILEHPVLRDHYLIRLLDHDDGRFVQLIDDWGAFGGLPDFIDQLQNNNIPAQDLIDMGFPGMLDDCSQELFDFISTLDQKEHREALIDILAGIPDIKQRLLSTNSYESCGKIDQQALLPAFLWFYSDYSKLWDNLIASNTGSDLDNMIDWFFNNDRSGSVYILSMQHPEYYAQYQDEHNLYSASGNGMETYFNHLKNYNTGYYNNLMSYYMSISQTYVDKLNLNEWMLYGNSRLGTYDTDLPLVTVKYDAIQNGANLESRDYDDNPVFEAAYATVRTQLLRGDKRFEMTNHLGNILSVVSDKKIPVYGKLVNDFTFTTTDEGYTSVNSSIVTLDGGNRLKAEGALLASGMKKTITTVTGNTYTVTFTVDRGNTSIVGARANNGTSYIGGTSTGINGTFTMSFIAQGTSTIISFEKMSNSGVSTYFYIDDVKVRNQSEVDYYGAEVIQANDYSPFGAPLAGRSYSYNRRDAVVVDLYPNNMNLAGWQTIFCTAPTSCVTPPTSEVNKTIDVPTGRLKMTSNKRYGQIYYLFNTVPGRVYRVKYKLSNSTMPLVNTSVFAPASRKELYTTANIAVFDVDREMIFTALESTTRFYITKGWSSTPTTPDQDIYLDYLTIAELPSQVNSISCLALNEAMTMLANSGANMGDTTLVKNNLNSLFNRTHTYQQYSDLLAMCLANPGSYVLAQPGAESTIVPEEYRFGFNGKEMDNEVTGDGNAVHYEFREYDARLGRFKSIDPRSSDYPWQSPYVYHRNNPILRSDYLGLGDPPSLNWDYFNSRHMLSGSFSANTPPGGINSVVTNPAWQSKATIEGFFNEAMSLAKQTGKTVTNVTLSNGTVWNINTSNGHFYPVSGDGITTLANQEVAALRAAKKGGSGEKVFESLGKNKGLGKYSTNMQKAVTSLAEIEGVSTGTALKHVAGNMPSATVSPSQSAAAKSRFGSSAQYIKWGGRTLLVVAAAADLYEVYQSENKPRTITKKVYGWSFAAAGAWAFTTLAAGQAGPQIAVPEEVLTVPIAGFLGGMTGYIMGETVSETIWEWVHTPVK